MKNLIFSIFFTSIISTFVFAKEFKDYHGRIVEVPDNPQRIVSLHPAIAIYIMELGLSDRLVAMTAQKRNSKLYSYIVSDHWDIDFDKVKYLGSGFAEINKEALKESKPDLILAHALIDFKNLESLSKIAPVIVLEVYGTGRGYRQFAALMNKTDVYDANHKKYMKKVKEVAKLFESTGLKNKTYAYVFPEVNKGQLTLIGQGGAVQKVSEDLGLTRLPSMKKLVGNQFFVSVSAESIDQLDADYLTVTYWAQKGSLSNVSLGQQAMDKIVPGWDSFMKAPQNNRVIYADFGQAHMSAFIIYDFILEKYKALAK